MGKRISGAELEIMEYLWEKGENCTFSELLDYFNNIRHKEWCKQTFSTYLLRLKKRGLLLQEKNGSKSVYCPAISQTQYNQICAEEILQESYGGVLSNFIAALTGKSSLVEIEKEKLLKYIMDERD